MYILIIDGQLSRVEKLTEKQKELLEEQEIEFYAVKEIEENDLNWLEEVRSTSSCLEENEAPVLTGASIEQQIREDAETKWAVYEADGWSREDFEEELDLYVKDQEFMP